MTEQPLIPTLRGGAGNPDGSNGLCVMQYVSWENGDTRITDFPSCVHPLLARVMQGVNDRLAGSRNSVLTPDNAAALLKQADRVIGSNDLPGELVREWALELTKVERTSWTRYQATKFENYLDWALKANQPRFAQIHWASAGFTLVKQVPADESILIWVREALDLLDTMKAQRDIKLAEAMTTVDEVVDGIAAISSTARTVASMARALVNA